MLLSSLPRYNSCNCCQMEGRTNSSRKTQAGHQTFFSAKSKLASQSRPLPLERSSKITPTHNGGSREAFALSIKPRIATIFVWDFFLPLPPSSDNLSLTHHLFNTLTWSQSLTPLNHPLSLLRRSKRYPRNCLRLGKQSGGFFTLFTPVTSLGDPILILSFYNLLSSVIINVTK